MVDKRFHELSIEAFVQATEDEDRVMEAMHNLIGTDEMEIDRSETEGIHDNPIIVLTVRIRKRREIESVLEHLKGMKFWEEAILDRERRTDEGQVFHVRVDKDSAYLDEPRIWERGESVKIRLKVATYPASRVKTLEILSSLL